MRTLLSPVWLMVAAHPPVTAGQHTFDWYFCLVTTLQLSSRIPSHETKVLTVAIIYISKV